MKKKILAIVPARGGSKSIPRKNLKLFAGKPLIVWSIEVGLQSGVLDRLIVSTDDKEIAELSKKAGAEVPFMRPKELVLDTTPTLPVLQHAVSYLKDKEGYEPDYILLLEPTAPGRQAFHLKAAVKIIEETAADSLTALGKVPGHFNPFWQFNLDKENKIKLFMGGDIQKIIPRRQELPATYFRNGAFYLFKTALLFASPPNLYGQDARGYVMEPKYSIDIDAPEDWNEAEMMFKIIQASPKKE